MRGAKIVDGASEERLLDVKIGGLIGLVLLLRLFIRLSTPSGRCFGPIQIWLVCAGACWPVCKSATLARFENRRVMVCGWLVDEESSNIEDSMRVDKVTCQNDVVVVVPSQTDSFFILLHDYNHFSDFVFSAAPKRQPLSVINSSEL